MTQAGRNAAVVDKTAERWYQCYMNILKSINWIYLVNNSYTVSSQQTTKKACKHGHFILILKLLTYT